MTAIRDDLKELLLRAYMTEADPNSLLRKLVAAVEDHFDSESDAGTELQEKLAATERASQQAAQRGWNQAFCEVDEVIRAAIDATLASDDPVERLEDVLEEIEGRWSYEPDPHWDPMAERAYQPMAKKSKPQPKAQKPPPAPAVKPSKPTMPTGSGGKHQRAIVKFLQSRPEHTATRTATRKHLIETGATSARGAYAPINRAIASDLVVDLGNDLIGLPQA